MCVLLLVVPGGGAARRRSCRSPGRRKPPSVPPAHPWHSRLALPASPVPARSLRKCPRWIAAEVLRSLAVCLCAVVDGRPLLLQPDHRRERLGATRLQALITPRRRRLCLLVRAQIPARALGRLRKIWCGSEVFCGVRAAGLAEAAGVIKALAAPATAGGCRIGDQKKPACKLASG